jgi:energy-coupling factor transporter transmembrane protein EcfT
MSGVHYHAGIHAHPPRLDPRGVVLLAVLFLLVVSSLGPGQFAPMLWLALLVHVCAFQLSIDPRVLWKHSLWVVPITLCAAPLGWWGYATVLCRSLLCVQAGLVLAWSLTPPVLIDTLQRLGLPWRLAAILRFGTRYLEVLSEEKNRADRARELRQLNARHTLRGRWTITGQLVAALFLRTVERAERVFQAMRSRGYHGRMPWSSLPPRAWGATDTMIVLHGLALLALTLCWS